MLNIGLDYHDCPRFYNNKTRIVVFYDNESQHIGVERCLQKWHGYNIQIIFVNIERFNNHPENDQFIRCIGYQIKMNWIDKFYIIPQSRKIRQSIRRTFKKMTDVDIHIKLYSKIVELVYRNSFRKG